MHIVPKSLIPRTGVRSTGTFLLLACLSGTFPAKATPISVSYTANTLGASLWTYSYTLTGTYSAQDDLSILFPLASSSNLSDLGIDSLEWTTFVLQPDPSVPADGEFDLVANVNTPSLAPTFSASFAYSGVGPPGSQAFTLYDPAFHVITSGSTQAAIVASPVPEPASLALLGTGLLGLVTAARRRR